MWDSAGLLLLKRKDRSIQRIYPHTIHGRCREMGVGALRDVSLRESDRIP
ncbi:hypothetical protein [Bartonella tribocorum]|uniref:Integrase n=1 Tax=Bartonella tribocorum (strain DSM 28219 / CCUG 45778 / CIP 105476 / IBS 506) TaxID=382640 RepID=A9IYY1_BART1|nr:hypothetical protein [Bartonella tribocorum]CAK02450.1 integrase fragment [Bartonella tribocorum CIP 105476]